MVEAATMAWIATDGGAADAASEPRAPLCIREADLADVPALARLRAAALVEMGLLPPTEVARFVARARVEFWELLRADLMTGWLLIEGDLPIGCACTLFWRRLPYRESSWHAEIAGVYVVPTHRGRGYASELLREAVSSARARNVRKIVLSPSRRARRLYERMGFTRSNQMQLRA